MELMVKYFVDNYGYLGLVLLVEISPVSSDLVLIISGFMSNNTSLQAPLIVLLVTLSSTIVGAISYYIGRLFAIEKIMSALVKWERFSPIKTKDIVKIREWFNQRGAVVVFICRLIPGLRSVISLASGMIGMKFWPFILLTIAGTFIWSLVCVYFGVIFGDNWAILVDYIGPYGVIMIILLTIGIWWKIQQVKKKGGIEEEN
ncbi:MAG: DedA family protein [Culicoidibacterales bacterium]